MQIEPFLMIEVVQVSNGVIASARVGPSKDDPMAQRGMRWTFFSDLLEAFKAIDDHINPTSFEEGFYRPAKSAFKDSGA